MSNEIKVQVGVQVKKDGIELVTRPLVRQNIDMGGDYTSSKIQLIGTSEESLEIGSDVAIAGFGLFRNLDTAAGNKIQIGTLESSTFVPFVELHVGDPPALIPLYSLDLYALATLSAARLQFDVFER